MSKNKKSLNLFISASALLTVTLLLSACGFPTPTAMPALSIALRPASTTIFFGGCDPHMLQIDATTSGDSHSLAYLQLSWVIHLPDGSLTPGATGSGFAPMTRTGIGMYTWSQDLGSGMRLGALTLIIDVYVEAISSSGAVLNTTSLMGLDWSPCPPVAGQAFIRATENLFEVYYGYGTTCLSYVPEGTVTFQAEVFDPAGVIAAVDITSQLERALDGVTALTPPPLVLTPTGSTSPAGGRLYSGSLDINSLAPSVPLGGGDGRLRWYARGLDSAGSVVTQYDFNFLLVHPCHQSSSGTGAHLEAATPATETPTLPLLQVVTNTPTSTTPAAPQLTLTENANCRKGPGTAYNVVTSFVKGKILDAAGRNDSNTWWLVKIPDGGACWVSDSTAGKSGPVEQLAIVPAPPLPDAPSKLVSSFTCDAKKTMTLSVTLNWATVAGATGFNIYRNGSLLTSVGSGVTSYTDNAPMGLDLTYAVEAVNADGHSGQVTTSVPACK